MWLLRHVACLPLVMSLWVNPSVCLSETSTNVYDQILMHSMRSYPADRCGCRCPIGLVPSQTNDTVDDDPRRNTWTNRLGNISAQCNPPGAFSYDDAATSNTIDIISFSSNMNGQMVDLLHHIRCRKYTMDCRLLSYAYNRYNTSFSFWRCSPRCPRHIWIFDFGTSLPIATVSIFHLPSNWPVTRKCQTQNYFNWSHEKWHR